jgi:hypothetical protein
MEICGAGRACELRHAPCFCGIGGSHAAPWRMSSQVGAYGFGHLGMDFAFGDSYSNKHFCIWGFVFEQAFCHFGIWGF